MQGAVLGTLKSRIYIMKHRRTVISINPFTSKSDQVQLSHSVENLAFHSLLRLKDDYYTNSHYPIYTFLFKKVGRMYF